MKSFTLIIGSVFLTVLFSCNQTSTSTKENQKDSLAIEEKAAFIDKNRKCFLATLVKDTAFLALKVVEGKVEGTLNYKFFEKDKNTGTVEGTLNNDTLNLIYTFSSEGSISTRPVKMLINNGQIFEIYGDEVATKGKGFIYDPSDCKE